MKKILLVMLCLLMLVGCGKKKEESISKITLDINPSIEINVKEDKVDSINALNDDAKLVLDKELEGETLEEALNWIINRSVDLDFIRDEAVVLVMIEGKYDQEELRELMAKPLDERKRGLEMIVIDKVTKEDEEFAKEHNISVAKAHFINELVKEREVDASDYVDKSISEIKETKDTGYTCDKGYTKEGDQCIKEVGREVAQKGKVCPHGFVDYKGKCYEEKPVEDSNNYVCGEGKLEGDQCILERIVNAIPSKYSCSKGTAKTKYEAGLTNKDSGDANDIVCEDTSNATHPVSPCELNDGTEHTTSGGKCYWHRAGKLPSGCPGKIEVNGECWDDASKVLICKGARDGKQYSSRNEYCEGSVKYNSPTVSEYKCEGNATLQNGKCLVKEEQPAERERICPSGFKKVENDRCINENNTKEFEDGYICPKENTRLEGDTCILLEVKEVNRN